MNELIMYLLIIIVILLKIIYDLYTANKIYYSNYQNVLLALSEYDPKLAEYLKKRGDSNGNTKENKKKNTNK